MNAEQVGGLLNCPQTSENGIEEVEQKQADPVIVAKITIAVYGQLVQRLKDVPKGPEVF